MGVLAAAKPLNTSCDWSMYSLLRREKELIDACGGRERPFTPAGDGEKDEPDNCGVMCRAIWGYWIGEVPFIRGGETCCIGILMPTSVSARTRGMLRSHLRSQVSQVYMGMIQNSSHLATEQGVATSASWDLLRAAHQRYPSPTY